MLDIVDMEGKREPSKYPTKQGGFDLIWDGGAVAGFDRPTSLPSMLGCYNPRDKNQLRRPLEEVRGSAHESRSSSSILVSWQMGLSCIGLLRSLLGEVHAVRGMGGVGDGFETWWHA